MKKSNLKVVKLDKNKSLFNYEKKILIKELTLDLKLGYYEFEKRDDEGWPHFKSLKPLPNLKAGEQTVLMKEAAVQYFKSNGYV